MKQPKLTEEQLEILQEIHQLVVVGEQQLKQIDCEMAQLQEKWRKIGEQKRYKQYKS